MIVLIDNYDSFSYNLYQMIGAIRPDVQVIRNDTHTIDALTSMNPSALILSPGPGKPINAGICPQAVDVFHKTIPILGVCLGHQVICEVFGATVTYAKKIVHGKASKTTLNTDNPLFTNCPETTLTARYHSLSVLEDTLPDCLQVTARSEDGEIMAVAHTTFPLYGLQFHPESFMTTHGNIMLQNFTNIIKHIDLVR